jgi:ArsR family transcriptional regulator
MYSSYSEFIPVLKAMSDDTRLFIIDMLSCGEMCACDILEKVNISQSTLSYHMKILSESGLVNVRKDGSWMRYSINNENSKLIISFLNDLTNDKVGCVCKTNIECSNEEVNGNSRV